MSDLGFLSPDGAVGQDAQGHAVFAQLVEHVEGAVHGDGAIGEGDTPVFVDRVDGRRRAPVEGGDDRGGAGVGSVATGVGVPESGAHDLTIDRPQVVAEALEETVEVGIDRAESIGEGAVEVEEDAA